MSFHPHSMSLDISDIVRAAYIKPSEHGYASDSEHSEAHTTISQLLGDYAILPLKKRVGNRRLQRWQNDQLQGHPLAVLDKKDLYPPGYTHAMPSFHFELAYSEPNYLVPAEDFKPKSNDPFKQGFYRVPKFYRNQIRRSPKAEEILNIWDKRIIEFLKGEKDEDTDTLKTILKWIVVNPFETWLLGFLAQYYGIKLYKDSTCKEQASTLQPHTLLFPKEYFIQQSEVNENLLQMSFYDWIYLK